MNNEYYSANQYHDNVNNYNFEVDPSDERFFPVIPFLGGLAVGGLLFARPGMGGYPCCGNAYPQPMPTGYPVMYPQAYPPYYNGAQATENINIYHK